VAVFLAQLAGVAPEVFRVENWWLYGPAVRAGEWWRILTAVLVHAGVAHIVFSISYVAIVVRARLSGFDRSLEEAALDLGARPLQTFWRVTLPLILPGIVAGALLVFTISIDDYVITSFVAGVGATTLPLQIYWYANSPYDDWHRQAWAGSFVLILLIVSSVAAVRYAVRRGTFGAA